MLTLVNAGLGRTGTTSLQAALDRLGLGPCFHMFDVAGDPARLARWEAIVCDGATPDWDDLFAGYASAVDGPCAIYHRELARAHPDARMMLTVRDPRSWYRSTHDTLYQFALRGRQHPAPPGSPPARMLRLTTALVWDGLFGGRFEDEKHAIEVYERHNDEVIRTYGPGLLVWDVTQGWGPLCEHLGVPVPDEPFPHANTTGSMQLRLRGMAAAAPAGQA